MKTIEILKTKYINKINKKIKERKERGMTWSDLNFRKYNILERTQQKMREEIQRQNEAQNTRYFFNPFDV